MRPQRLKPASLTVLTARLKSCPSQTHFLKQLLTPSAQDVPPKTDSGGYNTGVPYSDHESEASHKHHRHAVYASETMGLLLIALVLLILTVVRYWQSIHWSLH